MKNLSCLTVILLWIYSGPLFGQTIGDYRTGFSKTANSIVLETTRGTVKVDLCQDDLFRVRASWNGHFEPEENLMVVRHEWPEVKAGVKVFPDCFSITTDKLNIRIYKKPFLICVFTREGKLLAADFPGSGALSRRGDTVVCEKRLQAAEHFFGFGERMDFLDRRGKKVALNVGRGKGLPHITGAYNILEANYSPVPFFMSTAGYGLFLHNSFATDWDMGARHKDRYTFSASGGELDYYFFYGPDFSTILNAYTGLTGKSPLLPQFALGLHAGTYSGGTWGHEQLTSDAYVIALAKRYRAMGIPVDLIWLDSTWRLFGDTGGKGATSFEWRESFKNPKAMFDSIYAMHYKMAGLHIRPRIDNGRNLKLLDQARTGGYTYPENGKPGEFINFFEPKAAEWWWKNGVLRLAGLGVKFLKTDEGSAFGALANESEKVGPTGEDARRLHNLYPLAYARGPFEQFQQFNQMRGLNQTREGYAGIQRYPYIFAGDWPSEWQYFGPVIKAGLNIGLSGVGSWAHCMGGFEHVADPELYIRWVQFGMFSPIALVFGMDHPGYKEPWSYGNQALENFRRYDLLRYRMIPYLYTAMHQQYQSGLPMMRALVLDHQDDENTYEISDQYMLGDQLMVCPVTVKGAVTRSVYLPAGEWFNYWTGEPYSGNQYVHVIAPLDTLPLFVRGGAIIPMQPAMHYLGEKPADPVTLEVFPAGQSSFALYEDDGTSTGYEKGVSSVTDIRSGLNEGAFRFSISPPEGKFRPAVHHYLVKVHWLGKAPDSVAENGLQLARTDSAPGAQGNPWKPGWYFDHAAKTLWIAAARNNEQRIVLEAN